MRATLDDRLRHILRAIDDVRALLAGRTLETLEQDGVARAALERYIEIISEASRHIPENLKSRYPLIPWLDIAGIGNHIRHAYDSVDLEILWNIYLYELDALEAAVEALASPSDKGPP
ncbi:MAG TPA: HepT-like ribonuclease domain-containing protein [Methylocystis sp.]|nr:HepT-like ribonuclease domain-containing protein [Methylocystis sp.]